MNWRYWGEWPAWIDTDELGRNGYQPRVNDILRLDNGTFTITQDDATVPSCTRAVHAEANVINFAARYGISLEGATIYTTDTPCVMCAGSIINTGIVRVVAGREYRDLAGTQLLQDAGIPVITWSAE
jgi:dCMP deaminase